MNWCQAHWDELRASVDAKGLGKFGAQSAEELAADIEGQLDGEEPRFDPLMGSMWKISNHVLERAGLGCLNQCPLCYVLGDGAGPEIPSQWIDVATDSALQYAVEKGLVKTQ